MDTSSITDSLLEVLHASTQELLLPTLVLLILFAAYGVYCLGALAVEFLSSRRRFRFDVDETVARIATGDIKEMISAIKDSGLLSEQKELLNKLVVSSPLDEGSQYALSENYLGNLNLRYKRSLRLVNLGAMVGPQLGLIGTLLPLGPGLVGMGSGDIAMLSTSMATAFDTTVAGIVVAIVCRVISKIRSRWYASYMVATQSAAEAILVRSQQLRSAHANVELESTTDLVTRLCA